MIAGWETQIGRDFETGRPLGYRALLHRGFSESHPPRDADLERVRVVKEFMELWADSLHAGGVPRQRIFCHIAFTDQGLRKPDAKESYAVKVNFAPPEVAFSPAYRPGFSTYPEGATFKEIYGVLAKHGAPGWISAEGVNVSPTSMPGEPTMETYLGRMFNHGAVHGERVLLGHRRRGDARQFLPPGHRESRGAGRLRQVPAARDPGRGRSDRFLQRSVPGRRCSSIQKELPGWVQESGKQAQAMPLVQKLEAFIKDRKWQEADKVADELLSLMEGERPGKAKP